jgi:hypothetical protein
MSRRICKACNKGEVVLLAVAGRRTRFRCIPDLEIPAEVAIPTCEHCGTEYIDAQVAQQIDAGLKEAFQQVLAQKMEAALETLVPYTPQRELERLLGLSGGYLSKLKAGKETSATLVATLMLLAADPVMRLEELRQAWRARPSSDMEFSDVSERINLPGKPLPANKVKFLMQPPKVKGEAA